MSLALKVKKLDPRAKLPRYALPGDAGLDLFCMEGAVIPSGERHVFHLGIAIEIPHGYVGLVWDRGGHSKRGLKVFGGVFDSGYRGEVIVCLYNAGLEPIEIQSGNAVAQMLIQVVERAEVVETQELSESDRGDRRFSSTGM
jgi:dUTP pyrophosphatase